MNNKRTSSHFTDSLFERTAKWGNYKVPRAFPEKLWGHLHTRPPLASPHPNVLAVAWDSCCSDTLILNGCFFCQWHAMVDIRWMMFMLISSSSLQIPHLHLLNVKSLKSWTFSNPSSSHLHSPIKRVCLGWTSHGFVAPPCRHSTHPKKNHSWGLRGSKSSDSISFTCASRDLQTHVWWL